MVLVVQHINIILFKEVIMIPFCKATLGKEEEQAVIKVLRSGWLAPGIQTEKFEKEFADYVGVKYAIFTNSGTSALKMAYKYAKEEKYHKCFYCPENTFCATYSAGVEMGLKRTELNLSSMPPFIYTIVHYGGVKDEYYFNNWNYPSIFIIEDSAHRIEPNDPLIGDIRIYSFYVTKNMTTGSGGMFTTNKKEIYEKARLWWRDGITKSTKERHKQGAWNYRVLSMAGGYDGNDISAAIGRIQLKRLPRFTERRNKIVRQYNKAFRQKWEGNHLYPFFVKKEKEVGKFIDYMSKNGIQCGYHYPGNNWLGVSIPIYPLLQDKEVEHIIKKVKEWEHISLK